MCMVGKPLLLVEQRNSALGAGPRRQDVAAACAHLRRAACWNATSTRRATAPDAVHTDRVLIDKRRDHHEVSMGRWRHPRNRRGQNEPEEDERSEGLPAAPEDLPPEVDSGVAQAPGTRTIEDKPAVVEEVRMSEARDRTDVSVVGQGTRIEGTVVATGSLRVDGEVKGKITAEKEVSLSPRGRVEADIQADSITLAGQVKGDLNAKTDVSSPPRAGCLETSALTTSKSGEPSRA